MANIVVRTSSGLMFVFRGVQNMEVLSAAARDRLHAGPENKCNPRSLQLPDNKLRPTLTGAT
jgi:hypothetical protein